VRTYRFDGEHAAGIQPRHRALHQQWYGVETKLLDLAVSGNKGQLFSRLQGYVDGTVRPKKKRRR